MNNFSITSSAGQKMFDNLPAYYEKSRVMKADMNAMGVELDLLEAALNEVLDQFFVTTATWGLQLWEGELGQETDLFKPIEQRRSVVQSKLRGSGKFSGQLVKSVSAAYESGAVDVTFNPPAYSFSVRFVDTLGIPPNLDDLKTAIEEIKPAHMAVEYLFRYLMLSEIESMTLAQVEATTLDRIAWG